jgi:hypothetical protein
VPFKEAAGLAATVCRIVMVLTILTCHPQSPANLNGDFQTIENVFPQPAPDPDIRYRCPVVTKSAEGRRMRSIRPRNLQVSKAWNLPNRKK